MAGIPAKRRKLSYHAQLLPRRPQFFERPCLSRSPTHWKAFQIANVQAWRAPLVGQRGEMMKKFVTPLPCLLVLVAAISLVHGSLITTPLILLKACQGRR